METLSVKNKTLLFIFLVFICTLGTFLYIMDNFQDERLAKIKYDHFLKVETSYYKSLAKNFEDIYSSNAKIVLTDKIVEAFIAQDRELVYSLVQDIYKNLRIQDPYFEQMHFHLSDGTSFLRVHKPNIYGDEIATLRPMIGTVHREKKLLAGFEMGLHALSYRVVTPIFHNDIYVGALEFGISPKKALDLVTYFNDIQGLLYIDQQGLKENRKSIQFSTIHDPKLIANLPNHFGHKEHTDIMKNGDLYCAYSFHIFDLKGHKLGEFVFLNDLTQEYLSYMESRKVFLTIFILSGVSVFLIINFGFNSIISRLEDSYEKLKKFTTIIDTNIITSECNLEGEIKYASQAFANISGYSKKELIGKTHKEMKSPDINKGIYANLWDKLSQNQIWEGELKNIKKDGGIYWIRGSISPIIDKKWIKTGYTAVFQDITNEKKVQELLISDGLTGIYNRRYFNEVLPKFLNICKRENDYVSFVILDIDFFKQYNDTYGHQEGDNVLIQVASCLQGSIARGNDYVFRIGGEEFGILFKGIDENKSFEFVNKIRQNIENLRIPHSQNSASKYITASFGLVVQKGQDITNEIKIYAKADEQLYIAKENGRNRVCI
ncbi:MAG: diguanylate cyclase [Arcobacteraceae bacterium]|nr:diguanylate cyclase [Arcobacteraceae bacterium]